MRTQARVSYTEARRGEDDPSSSDSCPIPSCNSTESMRTSTFGLDIISQVRSPRLMLSPSIASLLDHALSLDDCGRKTDAL
jgi:hypothetical protein